MSAPTARCMRCVYLRTLYLLSIIGTQQSTFRCRRTKRDVERKFDFLDHGTNKASCIMHRASRPEPIGTNSRVDTLDWPARMNVCASSVLISNPLQLLSGTRSTVWRAHKVPAGGRAAPTYLTPDGNFVPGEAQEPNQV